MSSLKPSRVSLETSLLCIPLVTKMLMLLVLNSRPWPLWAWCTLPCTFFTGLIFRLLDKVLGLYYDCTWTLSYVSQLTDWSVFCSQRMMTYLLCLLLLKHIYLKIKYCIYSAAFYVDMRLLTYNIIMC